MNEPSTPKAEEDELRRLNALLSARSRQQSALLQEVHHRVKNNLQVIVSLVSMQARHVGDARAREALLDTQRRIQSIALIHDLLYQSEDFSSVPFSEYARSLASNALRTAVSTPARVKLEFALDPVTLPVGRAIPCGLALNELLTNALRHAFPGGRAGTVELALRTDESGTVHLSVRDDGVGLPTGLRHDPPASIGLQLVRALAGQIDGTIDIDQARGTCITMRFPLHSTHA